MAKVINPLLSVSASGQFAHSMVFDKRGFVREYVVPANPNTTAQQGVRNTLKDIQAELKLMGQVLRTDLKSAFGYRWNSVIISELMANNNAALDAYVVEWNAFVGGDKTAWEGADTAVPVSIADGALLYAVASAVYDIALRLGATITLTLPVTDNSAAVAAEWVDSTP
jgi:hypothetical protein